MRNNIEETLVIIKNETINRGLVGQIIQRFENVGLTITRIRMITPDRTLARRHYSVDRKWKVRIGEKAINAFQNTSFAQKVFGETIPSFVGSKIHKWTIDQLAKVSVILITLKGTNAVEKVKRVTGDNEPAYADLSTIRGIYSTDSYKQSNLENRALYNVIHRSSSKKEAEREISVWFENKTN